MKLERINYFAILYLKYAFPIVALAVALDQMHKSGEGFLWEVLGVMTVAWVALVIYIFFAIAFQRTLRDKVVRKLAGIHENDERESYLTGVISKKTFTASMGIMILMVFLSGLQVNVFRYGPHEAMADKKGAIQIGFGMKLLADPIPSTPDEPEGRTYMVKYSGLPLTSSGTLLVVMILQLGFFWITSRREMSTPQA